MKKNILFLFVISFFIIGCKDSQYVIKKENKQGKYNYAMKWYKNKKYYQAIPVIDDVLKEYKGTDTSELLYYMLAESYFQVKEYMVAAYHFKTFKDLYPNSYKSEVALYRTGECYEKNMKYIELEQTSTNKTIEYYKAFISEYPNSPMAEEARDKLGELDRRLELKFLRSADLYFRTKNFRAASVTYKNVLSQYPNIKEYEDIHYRICIADYHFAGQSTLGKQSERYEKALEASTYFVNRFPESKYVEEVKEVIEESREKVLEKAYQYANQYYKLEEREYYFSQAIDLWKDYKADFNGKIPASLKHYEDKCRLGVIHSYFQIFDNEKDKSIQVLYYNKLNNYYLENKDLFEPKSSELSKAEFYYNKSQSIYKKQNI